MLDEPLADVVRRWIAYVGDAELERLTGSQTSWATESYRAVWESSLGSHVLDRVQDLTIRTYLLDDLLPKVDRTSMAHALEVRSPFLDPEVVALALSLPPNERVRGRTGKHVLRRAMAADLPPATLSRAKWGFGIPLDEWFRGPLAAYAAELLRSPASRVRHHLRPEGIDHVAAAQASGASLGHAMWTLCTLELFLRREGW